MTRSILDSRRKVVSAIIHAYPGGRECAAALLGLELKKFDNHAYENAGTRPLADEQLHALEQVAGTTYLVDYLCNLYGGLFVAMPTAAQLDHTELYSLAMGTAVKRGKVDALIAQALSDGEINEAELAEIVLAHRQHLAARHTEVGAVVTLHRRAAL
ncbi:conserved protein of unknown function [Pseudomonas marincola]|uniref:Prophage PssSM-01 n=1 Tax=Pseudomonas marincola TaxID=437900 RepID=A0A653EAL2_9PSED|nr:YmfL family putative regulatory protein [Pseudomonas marincola]CAE6923652.1 conserved protein of unknown function [Pseudomonas marincola]